VRRTGWVGSPGAGGAVFEQPARPRPIPRIVAAANAWALRRALVMWVILLEAMAALVLLCFIVWWTMFSGRRKGERRADDADPPADDDGSPDPRR
jgi:hypothetical protein